MPPEQVAAAAGAAIAVSVGSGPLLEAILAAARAAERGRRARPRGARRGRDGPRAGRGAARRGRRPRVRAVARRAGRPPRRRVDAPRGGRRRLGHARAGRAVPRGASRGSSTRSSSGPTRVRRHLAGSGGILGADADALGRRPARARDLRPGARRASRRPPRRAEASAALRPVMALLARPVRVVDLPAGHGVSYGPSFVTARPSRIATLPVGYGDGWRRALSDRASALVRGVARPARRSRGDGRRDGRRHRRARRPGDRDATNSSCSGRQGDRADHRPRPRRDVRDDQLRGGHVDVPPIAPGVPCRGFTGGGPDARGREVRVARIELWNGDICDLEVDAIVSPASTSLWMSTGVAGELKRDRGRRDRVRGRPPGPRRARRRDRHRPPAGSPPRSSSTPCPSSATAGRATPRSTAPRGARWPASASWASRASRSRRSGPASAASPSTRPRGSPSTPSATSSPTPSSIEHVIFALRGAAAYEAYAHALSAGEPRPPRRPLARGRPPPRSRCVSFPMEPVDERREALVEAVAREIRLRGLTGPAVHFLEASRPYRPLGAPAMLFFDPVLRELFGGEIAVGQRAAARRRRDRGADRPARGAGRGRRLGRLTAAGRGPRGRAAPGSQVGSGR